MTFGPINILTCPLCNGIHLEWTFSTSNNFGATIYSDGYQSGLMTWHPVVITKCHYCSGFFWMKDAVKTGVLNEDEEHPEYPFVHKLSFEDLHKALNEPVNRDMKDELFLRTNMWWSYNDRFRLIKVEENTQNDPKKNEDNLRVLLEFFDDRDTHHKLKKAEILRHLGQFEDSIAILDTIDDPELSNTAGKLKTACINRKKEIIIIGGFGSS